MHEPLGYHERSNCGVRFASYQEGLIFRPDAVSTGERLMASANARMIYSDDEKRRLVDQVNRRYAKGGTIAQACEYVGVSDQNYYRWSATLGIPRPQPRWLVRAADAAADAADAGEATEAVAAIATVTALTTIVERPGVEADRLALDEIEAEADDLRQLLAELFAAAPRPTIVFNDVLSTYLDARTSARTLRARLDSDESDEEA